MRIGLIIEPVGVEPTYWANLLDCERSIQRHGAYIYENYDALPDILIFVPQNIFDYAGISDYFKILELCRYKDNINVSRISDNWMLYAVSARAIKKESREYYLSASSEQLRERFRAIDSTL